MFERDLSVYMMMMMGCWILMSHITFNTVKFYFDFIFLWKTTNSLRRFLCAIEFLMKTSVVVLSFSLFYFSCHRHFIKWCLLFTLLFDADAQYTNSNSKQKITIIFTTNALNNSIIANHGAITMYCKFKLQFNGTKSTRKHEKVYNSLYERRKTFLFEVSAVF